MAIIISSKLKTDNIEPNLSSSITINNPKFIDSSGKSIKIDNTDAAIGKHLEIDSGSDPYIAKWKDPPILPIPLFITNFEPSKTITTSLLPLISINQTLTNGTYILLWSCIVDATNIVSIKIFINGMPSHTSKYKQGELLPFSGHIVKSISAGIHSFSIQANVLLGSAIAKDLSLTLEKKS